MKNVNSASVVTICNTVQVQVEVHVVFKLFVCVVCSVASESAAGKVILDPDLWTKLTPVPPSPAALDDCRSA